MKSHQEERMVDVLGPPRHVRHDEGGYDGKDRTALLQTNAATQELLFDRGLCITAKRIAPWKGVGKQFGKLLVELLSPSFGIGSSVRKRSYSDSVRGKRIVRYPFLVGCAIVVMPASMCEDGVDESTPTSRNRGRCSTPLQTINRIRYNQEKTSAIFGSLPLTDVYTKLFDQDFRALVGEPVSWITVQPCCAIGCVIRKAV